MKKCFLLLVLCAFYISSRAQLTVTSESSDTAFIYSLAGAGVTITDLVRTCGDDASGYFNSSAANIGIDEGILLTSGSILNAPGPNNSSGITTAVGTAGDADLDALIPGYYTYDGCIIEFNMQVMSDTVHINYVFGSEEYQEWVGSSFNDVFAFWVSGPGITGTVNIATVPGTSVPVAINNVNATSYSAYYVDNGDGFTAPYSTDPYYVQYDGLTTMMEGSIPTISGETYHMKIAVADAGDGAYDTGVFIKTGSLGSLRMGAGYYGDGAAAGAGEKCSNGYIEFTNYAPGTEDLVIDYHISGTAVNGTDYETIADQITIPAGMSTATLPVIPLDDDIEEGIENIVLEMYNPQSGYVYNTLTFDILDAATADYNYDVTGAEVHFTNTTADAVSFAWDFGDEATSTEENPVHIYSSGGDHTVCLTALNANGCEANTCKQVSSVTAISDLPADLISLYPNPATDHFTIEVPENFADAQAVITNILGEEIRSFILTNTITEINTNSIMPGMYYIRISAGNNTIIKTVEIQ